MADEHEREPETDSGRAPNKKGVPDPDFCLLKSPLYTGYQVTTKDEYRRVWALFDQARAIDCFCPECRSETVFNRAESTTFYGNLPKPGGFSISMTSTIVASFLLRFVCARNNHHIATFEFRLKNGRFMKVGQYPSLADLAEPEIRRYSKILGEEKSRELKLALRLSANGVNIGAFVYLRRIFEAELEGAHLLAKVHPGWDEAEYQRARVKEKIALLADHLPAFLVKNKQIYSILSKGVHELSEEECGQAFPVMRSSIELILEKRLAQQAIDEKEANVNAALSKLNEQMAESSEGE